MRRVAFTVALLLLSFYAVCAGMRPADVRNPQTMGRDNYVSDAVSALSAQTVSQINRRCVELRDQLGVEIAVVIVPSIEGDDEYDFAYQLYNLWGVGDKEKSRGLLWLYVADLRAMKFETGFGLEGLLPDVYLSRLLDETIFPLMRQDEVDKAYVSAVEDIFSRLTTDEAREELLLNTNSPRNQLFDIVAWYLIISILVLMFFTFVVDAKLKSLRGENNVRYQALVGTERIALALAVVFPLPNLFMWLYLRRRLRAERTRQCRCAMCGGTMRLLSETEEDDYLDRAQQSEERVKSVDYDVWKCNVCGETKVLQYLANQTNYTVCPICGACTYSLVDDHVELQPTALRTGRGIRTHECASCHTKKSVAYTIPRLAPPVIVGGGRGFGGGSGFGGGFGGGMSGGGGAGGRF